jgi:hypothetical protein
VTHNLELAQRASFILKLKGGLLVSREEGALAGVGAA